MNEKFSKLGFYPSDILLPKKDVDMSKWAVVACDQFTSEPEYWERVEKTVGDAPSTLRLILPEANLKAPNVDEFIADINASMSKYLEEGIFETLKDSLIYIERGQSDGKIRHGLIGMVDLDQYDFTPGSGALIRATEGTVLDRIPPRARVRRNAPIELPHVMLLIDDPETTVIEPLTAAAEVLTALGAAVKAPPDDERGAHHHKTDERGDGILKAPCADEGDHRAAPEQYVLPDPGCFQIHRESS